MMDRLADFARDKDLLSIRRGNIDAYSTQGFLLGYSDELLLIQCICDFRLDGLMVLRTADITEIKCDATNQLQKELLIAEGLFQQVPFAAAFDLRDWKSILTQFARQYRFAILQDERPEDPVYLIGEIEKVTRASVWLRYFSGTGEWDEKPTKLAFSSITSCQVDAHYLNVYRRYFERRAR